MNQWLRRLDLRRNRALLLQAALLLVPPVTAFYLMQFILGAYPWQMSLGVVVANAICIGAVYYLLCALTGRWVISCVLLHCLGLPRHPGAALGSHRPGHCLRGLQQL